MRGLSTLRLVIHFVGQNIVPENIIIKFVKLSDQLVHIFTKSFTGPHISYICNKFGTYDDLYAWENVGIGLCISYMEKDYNVLYINRAQCNKFAHLNNIFMNLYFSHFAYTSLV